MSAQDDKPRDLRRDDAPAPTRTPPAPTVADLERALGAALARAEAAERDRDRLARRLRAIVAIGRGARVPDELADVPEPCGWATR